MPIIIYILISIFACIFLYVAILSFVKRNEARKHIVEEAYKEIKILKWAVAGSDDGCHKSAQTVSVRGVEYTLYKDANGKDINPDDYDLYIVDGESMQFCGIHNNNLIFATKGYSFDKSSVFPMVLVIRKNRIENDKPAYKIRRAWYIANYNDGLMDVAKNLLQSDKFQKIRRLHDYDGDTAVLHDFEESIEKYEKDYINLDNPNEKDKEVVISTTYRTREQKIRLSIHPITKVMGKVVASFPLSEKQLE